MTTIVLPTYSVYTSIGKPAVGVSVGSTKMIRNKPTFDLRSKERGQIIILVAVALIALLAMAALAIDVTTLYVARSEAQRTANAAALAGAKMFATSGFTSVQGGGSPPISQGDACNAATSAAQAFIIVPAGTPGNTVAGQSAIGTVTCNFAVPLNPQVKVVISRPGLSTFFAKIWSQSSISVSATAIAEAYNPSGLSAPIRVSVKPWLIPNCDISHTVPLNPNYCLGAYAPFVNTAIAPNDGSIANNGSFIGTKITVSKVVHNTSLALCAPGGCPPNAFTQYYPLDIPIDPPAAVCPSTGAVSCDGAASNYLDNIQCSSQYRVSCGDSVGVGELVKIENNNHTSLLTPAANATQCFIHASPPGNGLGQGQDVFTEPNGSGTPVFISGGSNNPNPVFAAATPNAFISRSDSIVTVPIYDTTGSATKPLDLCQAGGGGCNQTAKVVGFLQLGVTQSNPPPTPPVVQNGSFEAVIVNVAGCNPGGGGSAVSGGGVSPIPVRLVSP